uniref:Carcinoembryonic antigen-related cell adhesion molecule 1 n=1 Tax=Oncorhynchus kisutch TaxID=8019 RepID=A0A8C7MTP2_ONCKI
MDSPPFNFYLSLCFHVVGLCYGKGLLPADSMVGEVSHNVTFTIVNPPSTPFRVVAWTTNGTNVITSGGSGADDIGTGYVGRITLNSTTGSLELRNLVLSDTGEYVVTILAVGQPKEGTATLRVYERISSAKLTISPNPPIIEGGSVTLTCDASGSISNRDWRKDGQPLSPSERIIFSEDNKTVSISPLNLTDSGIFLCHLANLLSNENASYNLTVNLKGSTQGGPNVGAIVGGSLGAVAVVAVTAIGVVAAMKKGCFKKITSGGSTVSNTGESSTNGGGKGGNQELNYADITQFQKRDGGSVQLGNLGISSTEYATVRVNNRPGQPT